MSAQLDLDLQVSLDGQTPRVGRWPLATWQHALRRLPLLPDWGQEQLQATHPGAGIPSRCWLAGSLLSRALAAQLGPDLLLVGHHHPPMHG